MRNWLLTLIGICIGSGLNAQVQHLSVDAFERGIMSGQVQLLDVRTMAEYREEHLKNSQQADWTVHSEFVSRTAHLDTAVPVYVYCRSGGRSAAAADWLAGRGYKVYNLNGGIHQWMMQGKPTESEPRQNRMDRDSFQHLIPDSGMVLVDFFAPWCPPCLRMKPHLDSMAIRLQGKLVLQRIDGSLEPALLKSLQIPGFPMLILYRDGREIWRHNGYLGPEDLNRKMDEYLQP